MFRIVRKSTIDDLIDSNSNQFFELFRLQSEIDCLERELRKAKAENKRLFDHHNNKLTKPKPDKNGVLRYSNGQFASKNGK